MSRGLMNAYATWSVRSVIRTPQRGRKRTCHSHSPSTLHSDRRIKSSIAYPTEATDFTSKPPGIG
jgi:hypothetical protein